jgi:hypothetical protein
MPAMAGCGIGQAKVSGRVLHDGKPLPGGRVTFFPQVQGLNSVSTLVDEQGNYQADLPTCEVKVIVDNHELKPRPKMNMVSPPGLPGGVLQKLAQAKKENSSEKGGAVDPRMHGTIPGKYVEIPAKYNSVTTTPLSFTVHRGDQTHDIELAK